MDPNNNRQRLLSVLSLNTGQAPATWGITVVRTDYNAPEPHLVNALACINDAVRVDLGASQGYANRRDGFVLDRIASDANRPTLVPRRRGKQRWHPQQESNSESQRLADELFARYSTELLSEEGRLGEADVGTVRGAFREWIVERRGNPHGGDMRYVFCVVLDAEAIRQLHELWCLPGHGRRRRQEARVRVLDAIPGEDAAGAGAGVYSVGLRGEHGLVSFCFERGRGRQPLETMLTRPPVGEEGMWCFGPWEAAAQLVLSVGEGDGKGDGKGDGMPVKDKGKGKGKGKRAWRRAKRGGLKDGDVS